MNVNDLPFLPVIYLNKLTELMVEENIRPEYILRDCGLNASVLSKPDAYLSVHQVKAIVIQYLGLTPHAHAGIRYGLRLDLVTHGLFGFVFASQLSFRDLMTKIVEYLQVRFPLVGLSITQQQDYIAIRIDYRSNTRELEAFIVQAFLSSIYQLVSQVTRNITLHFQSQVLGSGYGLESLLSAPVELGTGSNEIRFYAADSYLREVKSAAEPLPAPDPFYEHNLVVRMRNYILTNADQPLSAEDVASYLGMSVRTLRRRLADIGMSFNDIRLEVRMQAALRYLKTSNLSIERIADIVGYSDQASFTRAFQKWCQETPDVVRRKHRQNKAAAAVTS